MKRLVREAVGSNLNGRCFVIYLFCFHGPVSGWGWVRIRLVDQNGTLSTSRYLEAYTAQFADKETYGQSIHRQDESCTALFVD